MLKKETESPENEQLLFVIDLFELEQKRRMRAVLLVGGLFVATSLAFLGTVVYALVTQ